MFKCLENTFVRVKWDEKEAYDGCAGNSGYLDFKECRLRCRYYQRVSNQGQNNPKPISRANFHLFAPVINVPAGWKGGFPWLPAY